MNITEANDVSTVIRAMAGDGVDPSKAAEALGRLHDRAYRALSTGPTGDQLEAAQWFLVDNAETTA